MSEEGTFDAGQLSTQLGSLTGEQFASVLPEAVRGQAYLKDVLAAEKPFEAFVNKFHGAQKVIGKHSDPFPKADWKDEQYDEFFGKLRPETDEAYQFPTIEGQEGAMPKEFQAQVRKMAHAAGIAPKQFERFVTPFLKAAIDAEVSEAKAANDIFDKVMTETFGTERESVLKVSKEVLAGSLNESQKALLNQLDDKGIAIVSALANGLFKKFGQEDMFRGGQGGANVGAVTMESLTQELRTAMADPSYSNPFKDKVAHQNAMRKVEAIKEKMAKLVQR